MNIRLPILAKTLQYKSQYLTIFRLTLLFALFFFSIFSGLPELQVNAKTPTIPQVTRIAIDTLQPEKRIAVEHDFHVTYAVSSASIGAQKIVLPKKIAKKEFKSTSVNIGTLDADGIKASILIALNAYRQKNGNPPLSWDGGLAAFAQIRADFFNAQNSMDQHAGFRDFTDNQNGFEKVGFYALGENSGLGHTIEPVSLIEEAYGKSAGHNANQLDTDYTHVGIGVSASATDFIFGGKKR